MVKRQILYFKISLIFKMQLGKNVKTADLAMGTMLLIR